MFFKVYIYKIAYVVTGIELHIYDDEDEVVNSDINV